MSQQTTAKAYPIEEALRAQKALRAAAGLAPELFPIPAFVGMVSDEIEALRKRGYTDEQIARTVSQSSAIEITAAEIAAHYASPEHRHPSDS
jgi:alkylhydroperoxidase family enzyme